MKPRVESRAGGHLQSRAAPAGDRRWHRRGGWFYLALLLFMSAAPAQTLDPEIPAGAPTADQEPITPIPQPPPADPLKVALGERLFAERRLSHDGSLSCLSCHDIHGNGADAGRPTMAWGTLKPQLNTPTVFNAALNFRLNWEGNFRDLEAHAQSSLESPAGMATTPDEVLKKLDADPGMVSQFRNAYGRTPDWTSVLDAIAIYERSLLTPGSRFDRWLEGDSAALTAEEKSGYRLFKSLGCISCHQGVNVGGNLFERHGIFRPLASPDPEIVRVPSLRNVAVTAPYFHDGSAATLSETVRKMSEAQLDVGITDKQVQAIVAFLGTLTGEYRGVPVAAEK